jgi:hypothetical protein
METAEMSKRNKRKYIKNARKKKLKPISKTNFLPSILPKGRFTGEAGKTDN